MCYLQMIQPCLRIGKIFKGLCSPCRERVIFVLLGTHGMKTHVKLVLGTNILKVIASTFGHYQATPAMSGRLIWSSRYLEHQNLSIISDSIA